MGNEYSLLNACNKKQEKNALQLLKKPEKINFELVDNRGNTALIYACVRKMKEVAIEILKHSPNSILDHVNCGGYTALIHTCNHEMKEVALEILKHPTHCGINLLDCRGNSALYYACINKISIIALEILNNHDICLMNTFDTHSGSVLTYSIYGNMPEVATKILELIESEKCKLKCRSVDLKLCTMHVPEIGIVIVDIIDKQELSHLDKLGNTSLMVACEYKQSSIALEILKYPLYCKLSHVNKNGISALDLAKKYEMTEVIKKIEEETGKSLEKLRIPDDLLRERITKKSCLFCGDDTEQSIIFSDCKHVVVSCDDCTPELHSNVCIMCRCVNNSIDKAYICT